MVNQKGNAYPLWIISNNRQVQSVDAQQNITNQSKKGFALEIAISEDGTLWVLSTESDPDGGGSKVYWSNGDNNWNEISTSDPGGVKISGYTGSSCVILTANAKLISIDTDGSSSVIYDNPGHYIAEFDYAASKFWAIISIKPGSIASLHYADSGSSLNWIAVGEEVYDLYSISVNNNGRCFGTYNYQPTYYDTDGSTGSAGTITAYAIAISVKTGNFVLSDNANQEGNLVYQWTIQNEGSYVAMDNVRAQRVCASYNTQ